MVHFIFALFFKISLIQAITQSLLLQSLGSAAIRHSLAISESGKFTEVKVAQSCPTLCNPMNCNPPGSSDHEILQARILEKVVFPSSREYFGVNFLRLNIIKFLYWGHTGTHWW